MAHSTHSPGSGKPAKARYHCGMPELSERKIYTVTRLNREVRMLLERGLAVIWLEAELSNLTQPGSGHWYFTLKDGQVLEARRDYATGSPKVPMTQAQVEEKFLDCAAQALSPETSRKVLAALNALPDLPSFNDVWPLLRRA